ncbi:hypothetical protein STEG23_023570, partial [Scotinomys teguina]
DFIAAGLDQLTLCSQSLGFNTPAAPVQIEFMHSDRMKRAQGQKAALIGTDLKQQE